jgi:biotin carboxyl carrier protein
MPRRHLIQLGSSQHEIAVETLEDGRVRVVVDGQGRVWDVRRVSQSSWSLLPPDGGQAYLIDVDGAGPLHITVRERAASVEFVDPRGKIAATGARAASGPTSVRSPMPGKVIKLLAAPGTQVKAGQGLLIVEAMKMENEIRAPRDGKVSEVSAKEGQTVEAQQVLAIIE